MKTLEEKLMDCYKEYAVDLECSIEEVKQSLKDDWGEYGPLGFSLFVSDETKGLHIERIDEMGVFDSDGEAAEYAEKHLGIKLIPQNQIIDEYPYKYIRFIDSEDNRARLKEEEALL